MKCALSTGSKREAMRMEKSLSSKGYQSPIKPRMDSFGSMTYEIYTHASWDIITETRKEIE